MAQTSAGALKTSAAKAGITISAYRRKVLLGLKRCYACGLWKEIASFNKDRTRHDGLCPRCRLCLNGPGTKAEKISAALRGRVSTFKGRIHTAATRLLMSRQRKGKPQPHRLGAKHTLETRAKISATTRRNAARGELCHSYKDGKLAERRGQRLSGEYKRWRYDVFTRDRFTCQHCGDARGGNLRAHHIKEFADHPDLRFVVSNGLTLCDSCHKAHHSAASSQ